MVDDFSWNLARNHHQICPSVGECSREKCRHENRNHAEDTSVNGVYKSLCETFSVPIFVPRVRKRIAKKLVDRISINSVDARGRTLLMLSCIENKQDIACFLLDAYKQSIMMDNCDVKGNTALHYACMTGRPSLVARLTMEMLKRSIGFQTTNKQGLTAVDVALRYGNVYAADIVIKDFSATSIDSLMLDDPELRRELISCQNMFMREDQTMSEENYEYEDTEDSRILPLITKQNVLKSCQERCTDPPIPKFNPRKSSKIVCSYLFNLQSMQETVAYRQGFPLVNVKGSGKSIGIVESYCESAGSSTRPTSQVGERSRYKSSPNVTEVTDAKPDSVVSTPKYYGRQKSNSILKTKCS